jgi:hypothetical protein
VVNQIEVNVKPEQVGFLAQEIERILNSSFFNHYGQVPYVTIQVSFTTVTPSDKVVTKTLPAKPKKEETKPDEA